MPPRNGLLRYTPALVVAIGLVAGVSALLLSLTNAPDRGPPSPSSRPSGPPPAGGPSPAGGLRGIEGRVTRAGQGVEAPVRLSLHVDFKPPPEPLLVRSDVGGRYAFREVPAGTHLVEVETAAGLRVCRRVVLRSGDRPERLDFELPAAGLSLVGRAIHADGRPFGGFISCAMEGEESFLWRPTDAEGRFRFDGLRPGEVHIRFGEEGRFKGQGPSVTLPREGEVEIRVDDLAREIRGLVLAADGGLPIPGAVVVTKGWTLEQRHREWRTVSDPEGRFTTRAIFGTGFHSSIEVTAPGFWQWILEYPDERPEYEVRLERSAKIVATVVSSADGSPLAGVPVVLGLAALNDGEEESIRLTGSDGRAVFDVVSAFEFSLAVHGNGWRTDGDALPEDAFPRRVRPGETTEVVLPAVRCARIEGRVVDAAGSPVQAANLGLRTSRGYTGLAVKGDRFVLDDLPEGDFALKAEIHGLASPEVSGTLASGEVRNVELRLAPGARVEVHVVEAGSGAPVPYAQVNVGSAGPWWTDEDGTVRIGPLRPGPQEIVVDQSARRSARTTVDFPAGETCSVRVPLEPGLEISGRLVFPDGTPADHGDVGWYGIVVDADGNRFQWYDERRFARIGPDGAFRLVGLPSAVVELVCRRYEAGETTHRTVTAVRAGEAGVTLGLKPEDDPSPSRRTTLELHLLGPDGSPVPCARYQVAMRDDSGGWIKDDWGQITGGVARIDLPEQGGRLWLLAYAPRSPTGYPLPFGAKALGPIEAKPGVVEMALEPERFVTGIVRGPDGRGAGGLRIEGALVWEGSDEPIGDRRWQVRTDESGAFRIDGLWEGEVELVVDAPEGLLHPGPVRVPAGTSGVQIRLEGQVEGRVTVLDQAGRPVPRALAVARLTAMDGEPVGDYPPFEPSPVSARSDDSGVAALAGLRRAGVYRLDVYSSPQRPDLAPIRIVDWVPRDETVRLPPGLSVSGEVVGPDGGGVPEGKVNVWYWTPMGYWSYVKTAAGGRFTIRGLPEATIGLTLRATGCIPTEEPHFPPTAESEGVVLVPAGAEGLVLTYPPRK